MGNYEKQNLCFTIKTDHNLKMKVLNNLKLAELHVHLGSIGDPAVMWDIAHASGLRLPVKDYWDFRKLITVEEKTTFEKYLKIFDWTELIQSSPMAIERIVYEAIGGAYRTNNITTLELRYNPMKRNRGGEQDLDHVIMASLRGLDRASLAFPQVKAGLIFMLDRSFNFVMNKIILEKAIHYNVRGVVGVDIGGSCNKNFSYQKYRDLIKKAKKEGLGITIHAGEKGSVEEMWKMVGNLGPQRIGHGIKAAWDLKLMRKLVREKIILEICPTSNLKTQVVKDLKELRFILQTFLKNKVQFTINTDGPTMLGTNLRKEYRLLYQNKILSKENLLWTNKVAHKASFIK